jgi:hypothetical protein
MTSAWENGQLVPATVRPEDEERGGCRELVQTWDRVAEALWRVEAEQQARAVCIQYAQVHGVIPLPTLGRFSVTAAESGTPAWLAHHTLGAAKAATARDGSLRVVVHISRRGDLPPSHPAGRFVARHPGSGTAVDAVLQIWIVYPTPNPNRIRGGRIYVRPRALVGFAFAPSNAPGLLDTRVRAAMSELVRELAAAMAAAWAC